MSIRYIRINVSHNREFNDFCVRYNIPYHSVSLGWQGTHESTMCYYIDLEDEQEIMLKLTVPMWQSLKD